MEETMREEAIARDPRREAPIRKVDKEITTEELLRLIDSVTEEMKTLRADMFYALNLNPRPKPQFFERIRLGLQELDEVRKTLDYELKELIRGRMAS